MQTIQLTIPASKQEAKIIVGDGILASLSTIIDLSGYTKILIVGDRNVRQWVDVVGETLPAGHSRLILPPGEKAKHIGSVQKIWQALLDAGCDRKSLLIAVGGGVIGDMAGFAATTYMRGIDFVHVPTSLVAQVDSSAGGKTGIDFGGVKNPIGTFGQPVCTLIDVRALQTLPKREFISGFGELIKHGLIRDKAFLELVTSKKPLDFSPEELVEIIAWSCRIKVAVVAEDERESGLRKVLNSGHSVGHAIEALSLTTDKPLLHGEAVSIGLVVEAELAHHIGLLTTAERRRVAATLKAAGLPVRVPAGYSTKTIIAKMRTDKKNLGDSIRFALLQGIGDSVWDIAVEPDVIATTLQNNGAVL